MCWVSELEGSEFQTMFISHIYAKRRLRAGDEILVNYGRNFCERFVLQKRVACERELTNQSKNLTVTGELWTVI